MKNWQKAAGSLLFLLFFMWAGSAEAHVIDEVTNKQAAAESYEDFYTLQKRYVGESGVTFESYSYKWKTIDQLKALEKEMLQNKHGKELPYLGKVQIFPDYPAGDNVLGQYYARYETQGDKIRYSRDRMIQLYGGDKYNTPELMATTLSHEYGHHFTYYYLIEGEKASPSKWLSSQYAKARGLDKYSKVGSEYIWSLPEILAEDYVQLFGSENAIKEHMHMNGYISSPFDNSNMYKYWNQYLKDRSYSVEQPISLYLTGYQQASNLYDLKLFGKNLTGTTYINAQDGSFYYAPVQIGSWKQGPEQESWIRYSGLPSSKSWVLDGREFDGISLQAIQHNDQGFNRGSSTLNLSYSKLGQAIRTKDQINAETAKQYTIPETKQLLREVAVEKGIPAEILKAIAYHETGMKQFDAKGMPIITSDGGIGIMQVTLSDAELVQKGIDKEKLKWDTRYNIEVGANILLEKWNLNLPKINSHDKSMIEDWYFAVMAYNGLSKRNDPNLNKDAYQEKVYNYIRNLSLLKIGETPKIEISYPYPDKPDIIVFSGKTSYQWPTKTRTTQNYRVGDSVYAFNTSLNYSNLRNGIDGSVSKQLLHYTPLQIIGGPYETTTNPNNQYTMYKVKGNGFEGYVASANILQGRVSVFPDINSEEVASAVSYLQLRDIITGYTDGTFKPNNVLIRRHAAKLIVNALDLKLPKDYKLKATDMKPGQLGYEEMAIAEAYGLMGSGGKLRPEEPLTRAQMAKILVNAFNQYYEKPTKNYSFSDSALFWNYSDINTLAHNKITVANPFRPNDSVTRSQFALFLERTIKIKEAK